MPDPWSPLVLVVAVAAGLVTVTATSFLARSWPTAFFRYLQLQVLLFNLLILGGLIVEYIAGPTGAGTGGTPPGPALILLAALVPLKFAWLWAFAAMTLVLPGQELPSRFRRAVLTTGIALVGVSAVVIGVGAWSGSTRAAVTLVIGVVEVGVIGGAFWASARLLIRGRDLPSGPRRRSVAVLAGGYLGTFSVMAAALSVAWLRPSDQATRQISSGVILLVCNLMPLVWAARFQPKGPVTETDALDRYGISPREREIIALIAAGCTNQEVADRLFISLATVKDHNYNIFRKMGVRNRVELVNLARAGHERGGRRPGGQDEVG